MCGLCEWRQRLPNPWPTACAAQPPPAPYPSPRIVLSVLVPWVVWMSLMVMMLLYQGADEEHVDMQPQLSKGVGCALKVPPARAASLRARHQPTLLPPPASWPRLQAARAAAGGASLARGAWRTPRALPNARPPRRLGAWRHVGVDDLRAVPGARSLVIAPALPAASPCNGTTLLCDASFVMLRAPFANDRCSRSSGAVWRTPSAPSSGRACSATAPC